MYRPWRHRYLRTGAAFFFAVCVTAGCSKKSDEPPPPRGVEVDASIGARVGKTEPADHSIRALVDRIADRDRRLRSEPNSRRKAEWRRELVTLHIRRARYLGKLDSYQAALEHADALLEGQVEGRDLLLRAHARMALHKFEGAASDLRAAAEAGSDKSLVEPLVGR